MHRQKVIILHICWSIFLSPCSGLPPHRGVQPNAIFKRCPEDDRCSLGTYQGPESHSFSIKKYCFFSVCLDASAWSENKAQSVPQLASLKMTINSALSKVKVIYSVNIWIADTWNQFNNVHFIVWFSYVNVTWNHAEAIWIPDTGVRFMAFSVFLVRISSNSLNIVKMPKTYLWWQDVRGK